MKLDTIKLLQESFNVNESVAQKLLETLDAQLIAKLVAEKLGKPVTVQVETKAKPVKVKNQKIQAQKMTQMERVKAAIKSYSKGTPVTSKDIAEATGLDRKAASIQMWRLYDQGELKSNETGIYITK